MCLRHWRSLPKRMQAAIWASYRVGQCDDWRISHAYVEAAKAAVRWAAEWEGIEADVSVYDMLDPERKVPLSALMTPWQRHVQKWDSCTRCELCHGRDKVCLARGSLPATVCFIAEAPGDSEDTLGKPLVGPAGKKMDAIIKRAAIEAGKWDADRDDTTFSKCFTNLVGCFPREQKRNGNGEPEPEHIQACAPRLDELVRMAKPKLIVCVGGPAEAWIMGVKKGKRHLIPWYDGKLTAITHPAAVLRANSAQQGLMVKRMVVTLVDAFEGL